MENMKNLPIEERFVEHETNGRKVLIPALNRTWVKFSDKNFTRYISHPDPGLSNYLKERELWLEITHFMVEDLEWLLRQKHHIFWSHMIYSMEAQWLILTFLQEAPPYYLRKDFPKDEEMECSFAKAEHLTFLVLRRLATRKESKEEHIRNLGDLLYNSYLFTIPMFFDIFAIYGFKNRQLVSELFEDVVSISPRFLQDLEIVPPFFMKVLQIVKEKFDSRTIAMLTERNKLKPEVMKNVFIHLHDTTANMQIFFDINTKYAKCMRTEAFLSDVAFFYTHVVPKINGYFTRNDPEAFDNFKEKIDFVRLNLLSIVRSVFCCTINDVVNDEQNRLEFANEYLTRLMDILQEHLFISDYNKVYPIDNDLRMLCDLCPNMDTINLKYISEAVASCSITKYKPGDLKEYRLGVLISEIKEILPDLGDGFLEYCLRYYDFSTEKVVTAIIEDTLPLCLNELDRNMQRPNEEVQRIIRARINAEKQWRMDKGLGVKQKTDKVNANSEREQKMDEAGACAVIGQKMDRAEASGGFEQKMDEAGACAVLDQKMDRAEASGGFEQKMDEAGACAVIDQKMDRAEASGGFEQKMDEAGACAVIDQKMDKAEASGGFEQKMDEAGACAVIDQKMDKAEASGVYEPMDKPGTSYGNPDEMAKARVYPEVQAVLLSGVCHEKIEPALSTNTFLDFAGKKEETLSFKRRLWLERSQIIAQQKIEGEARAAQREKAAKIAAENQEMIDVLNDKSDLLDIKHRILNLSLDTENYEDEYDDTYDFDGLSLKECRNVDEDRKFPFKLCTGDQAADAKIAEEHAKSPDGPASVKARLLQKRMGILRRDFIDRKKAQMRDRDVLAERHFKDVHKSSMGNHNRKKAASRKRNMSWSNS